MSDSQRLTQRIRAEYQAIPTLKLTSAQACRLWSASPDACDAALAELVAEGTLWLAPSGRYVALPAPHSVAVKGDLRSARCPHCQKRNAFERDAADTGRDLTITLRCTACHRVFSFSTIAA